MECRSLDINIKNAKGLKNVNLFSTMDVYAVVSISGDPRGKLKQKTPVANDGGSDPHWNFAMKFTINEAAAQSNRLNLKIKLVSERSLGDKKIGKVIVPIKQLLDECAKGDEGNSERTVSFGVRTASGKEKGNVEFSYKFGEKYTVQAPPPPPVMKTGEAVAAYPQGYAGSSSGYPAGGAYPPPAGSAYAYPPPPQGYGYPPPPPQGYGYPPAPQAGYAYGGYPPQSGYGYPPVQQQHKPQKSGIGGMALGAGAGLVGGLLIGDMISDIGDSADAGFGDGFDF
ncbi:Protein SRC2, partial [Cucurbita argyrosperma subsp. sororia]